MAAIQSEGSEQYPLHDAGCTLPSDVPCELQPCPWQLERGEVGAKIRLSTAGISNSLPNEAFKSDFQNSIAMLKPQVHSLTGLALCSKMPSSAWYSTLTRIKKEYCQTSASCRHPSVLCPSQSLCHVLVTATGTAKRWGQSPLNKSSHKSLFFFSLCFFFF